MKILLIASDGIDLYDTLSASETSRLTLRFYRPERRSCGVAIRTGSLGSALSIVSELKWYVRRYVREVLYELPHGAYATQALADEIYQRDVKILPTWDRRFLYCFKGGSLVRMVPMDPAVTKGSMCMADDLDAALEVWTIEPNASLATENPIEKE
jgi:hypothetical protein